MRLGNEPAQVFDLPTTLPRTGCTKASQLHDKQPRGSADAIPTVSAADEVLLKDRSPRLYKFRALDAACCTAP
jgi:hypothetical protein